MTSLRTSAWEARLIVTLKVDPLHRRCCTVKESESLFPRRQRLTTPGDNTVILPMFTTLDQSSVNDQGGNMLNIESSQIPNSNKHEVDN